MLPENITVYDREETQNASFYNNFSIINFAGI